MSNVKRYLALAIFMLAALPLSNPQASTTSWNREQERKKPKKNKGNSKTFIILGITVVAIGGGAWWWINQPTSPEEPNKNNQIKSPLPKKSKKIKKKNLIPNQFPNLSETLGGSPTSSPSTKAPIIINKKTQAPSTKKPYGNMANEPFVDIKEETTDSDVDEYMNASIETTSSILNNNLQDVQLEEKTKEDSNKYEFISINNNTNRVKPLSTNQKNELDINVIIENANKILKEEKQKDTKKQLKTLCGNCMPECLSKVINENHHAKKNHEVKDYLYEMMSAFLIKESLKAFQEKDEICKEVLYKDSILYGSNLEDRGTSNVENEELARKERIADRLKNFLDKHEEEKKKAKEYIKRNKLKDKLKDYVGNDSHALVSKETVRESIYEPKKSLEDVQLRKIGERHHFSLNKKEHQSAYKAIVESRHEIIKLCWEYLKKPAYDKASKDNERLLPTYLIDLLRLYKITTNYWHWLEHLEKHKPHEGDTFYPCIIRLLYAAVRHPQHKFLIYKTTNSSSAMFSQYEKRIKKLYDKLKP